MLRPVFTPPSWFCNTVKDEKFWHESPAGSDTTRGNVKTARQTILLLDVCYFIRWHSVHIALPLSKSQNARIDTQTDGKGLMQSAVKIDSVVMVYILCP